MNVAFIIYKRPDQTRRVFERIAQARPDRLLVVADGPKDESERLLCDETREIALAVDWPCEVLANFSDVNMGVEPRVITGLNWVFEQVQDAVILEDDCLPHPTFFPYCSELLDRYRDNEEIAWISGDNFLRDALSTSQDYFISLYGGGTWGWATWRRAWALFDNEMSGWKDQKSKRQHYDVFQSRREAERFEYVWDTFENWDYRWTYSCIMNRKLALTPRINLVANIGFGPGATHTVCHVEGFSSCPTHAMTFPLRHPQTACRDFVFERAYAVTKMAAWSPRWKNAIRKLGNKHFYGAMLSRIPLFGHVWKRIRGYPVTKVSGSA